MKTSIVVTIAIAILALVVGTALADSAFDVRRISNLINAQAIDPSGKTLGTIDDLVLGADHRISYVVVAKSDKSGFVAVPIEAADPRVNPTGEVVLSISKDNFDKVAVSAINDWPDTLNPSDSARGYRGSMESQKIMVNGIHTYNPYPF